MHATPSEISITQAYHRIISSPLANEPPEKLSKEYIIAHSGDRHEGPEKHRASFPDGRVGSHSALAKPEHGVALTEAAVLEIKQDYLDFLRA
jgi:creatinine amidohydrolase